MSKFYILYDGRALTQGTDNATILEALGKRFTAGDLRRWEDHDAVLFVYDEDMHTQSLRNERLIGHVSEGFAALKEKA